MQLTTSETTGIEHEKSIETGRAPCNLNRDGATRTMDAIDFGVEIQDQISQVYPGSSYKNIEDFCTATFGISYAQCCKYRRVAFAAYSPSTCNLVQRFGHRGLEVCFEKIAPHVTLRHCARDFMFTE